MAWSIRNYNAFIRTAKAEFGLNRAQAARMYSHMSERLARPLVGRDLAKHPRIAAQEAKRAPRSEAATRAAATRAAIRATAAQKRSAAARQGWKTRRETARQKAGKQPKLAGAPVLAPKEVITIHDADEWLDNYDSDMAFDSEEYEGTPEYGETER